MAKQTTRQKRTEPTQEDFQKARDLLRQRASALILDLAKRYQVTKAEELTTVLDAIDSLAELEKDARRLSEQAPRGATSE